MDELEKEVMAMSLSEIIEKCEKDNIKITADEIESFMASYNVDKPTAIKHMYLGLIAHYEAQEEAMQEVYEDIIRSSH